MKAVSIVDYGIGNLLSVVRGFEYFQTKIEIINTSEQVMKADRLVLPGVGAFQDGMRGLTELGLVDSLKQYGQTGRPFMGICLGMQMMLSQSHEFGLHKGLDLIEGEVESIPPEGIDGTPHKIPHIGWNCLQTSSADSHWENTILKDMVKGASVYFVHSYRVIPKNPEHRLADTFYDGQEISAVIKKDNLYGCQFHPEKSGEIGLKILENFIRI
ncbi:imidazole glycerol phosphate synthase subunit HisH [Legionella waltersii]|uniref:Imidazole glycerol phosphate synthase subunit HisH n=1 Tax=Legionella waltersii TaxID=66969 RepID=A0A0W1AND0_9GAMM|nr:imidazole glycerol phosphate synthase subunit HisH [Legionella waltersii]KTD82723.1 imidazole glycerol phosphate synthase subunit HisH [Legionella waltersii]SNV00926.1 glutamine amidotransferase [Legionella waltersii]